MFDGGIRFVEITFSKNESDNDVLDKIKIISDNFKGKLHVGAGTVLNETQVKLTKKAGGEFIVSPDTCKEVISKTKELGMVSIPGAFTPTEIVSAFNFGADFIKLFPAKNVNLSYIKAIKTPLNNIKLFAFSGIKLNNVKKYAKAGVCGFGIGSDLIDKKLIKKNDFISITKKAKKFMEKIK